MDERKPKRSDVEFTVGDEPSIGGVFIGGENPIEAVFGEARVYQHRFVPRDDGRFDYQIWKDEDGVWVLEEDRGVVDKRPWPDDDDDDNADAWYVTTNEVRFDPPRETP